MSNPKKHHYAPQWYLRGFSDVREEKATLHALDLVKGEQRQSTPKKEGFEKHLYSIEIEGQDAGAIEKTLSHVDGLAADIVREIKEQGRLPDDSDRMGSLLMHVALQHMRVPSVRAGIHDFNNQVFKMHVAMITESEEHFEASKRNAEARTGEKLPDDFSREDLRRWAENTKMVQDNASLIRETFKAADTIFETLADRNWCLVRARSELPDFVTCDNPVNVFNRSKLSWPAGFGLRETIVTFPLTRRFALHGQFEPLLTPVVDADRRLISEMNGICLRAASRYVWSRRPRFHYMLDNELRTDPVYAAARLRELRRKERRKGSSSD